MKVINKEKYSVIEFPSYLTRTDFEKEIEKTLNELENMQFLIALDMESMERIYSPEIYLIVKIFKGVQAQGKQLSVVNANPFVIKVLHSANLQKMVPIYKTIEEFEMEKDFSKALINEAGEVKVELHREGAWTRVQFRGSMVDNRTGIDEIRYQKETKELPPLFLLDFRALEIINSYGLQFFINFARQINARKGSVAILGANDLVRDLIKILEIGDLFFLFEDIEEARNFLKQRADEK